MLPPTIRWRLPLSYAAIALLTTLALGAVLLLALRGYYVRLEREYLEGNARAISGRIASAVQESVPQPALQSLLEGFAFLSQTRVRLLDLDGRALVDTGELNRQDSILTVSVELEGAGVSQAFSQTVAEGSESVRYRSVIVIEDEARPRRVEVAGEATGGDLADLLGRDDEFVDLVASLAPLETPYGFRLGGGRAGGRRSEQVVRVPIVAPIRASTLGFVELSEGPAYGREILAIVAVGWGLASGVAVLVAGLAGWWASRRLSAPLVALTAVTRAMAAGDLSVRANVARRDEIGALGRAFNRMAGQVETTVSTLRRFVADAAHELHTPLTALRTNLELAASDPAHIIQAQAQVERLTGLTTGLLDLSRLESGATAADKTAFETLDFGALVAGVSEPFASQAEQKGIELTLALPDTAVAVMGNRPQLRQAMSNLLDNAIKFTLAGGEIEVAVTREAAWMTLTIADTGIGIPEKDLEDLFGRFHRGRNAAGYAGSGLGLAIVQAIVKGHGGRVWAENTQSGARFVIQLRTFPQMDRA